MHAYPASKESKARRAKKQGKLWQNLCIKGSAFDKGTFQLCGVMHFYGAVLFDTRLAHVFIIIVDLRVILSEDGGAVQEESDDEESKEGDDDGDDDDGEEDGEEDAANVSPIDSLLVSYQPSFSLMFAREQSLRSVLCVHTLIQADEDGGDEDDEEGGDDDEEEDDDEGGAGMEPYQQNYLQILSGDAEAYEEEVMRCSSHIFFNIFLFF